MPLVIVGESAADEIAVEQQAPDLAIEQGEREAALQSLDGEFAVGEVELVQFVGEPLQIARPARSGIDDGTADDKGVRAELEQPAARTAGLEKQLSITARPLPARV